MNGAIRAGYRISRRSWLLAGLAIPLFRARAAGAALDVTFDGDNLHVAAPGLHFLTGKPLERLKNGDTVTFLSQLTLFSDEHGTVFRRAAGAVGGELRPVGREVLGDHPGRVPGRSASLHGCGKRRPGAMENLAISALGLAPERPFWLRFELRDHGPARVCRRGGGFRHQPERPDRHSSANPGGRSALDAERGSAAPGDLPRTAAGRGRNG